MKRLAIITTHPIQYNAPWFELLTARNKIIVKVFYTRGHSGQNGDFDAGFGKVIKWDIPLLNGYDHTFVKNVSEKPGTEHFKGIINPSLTREIEEWGADAILVFGWSFQSHLKCLRYFHGKLPVLFRGDSTLLDEDGGVRKIIRRIILKWVYRHVDIALYPGTNSKAYFVAHGLKERQLAFAPHAIDNKRFSEDDYNLSQQARSWRKELGYREDDIVLLFAGKLEPKKDPGILLELLKRMGNSRIKVLMVGNGELENELKGKAEALGAVQFINFQNQTIMPVVYRLADIFILPSKGPGETWGLAINEALACGRPVIASDKVGGAVDLIRPGMNGYIFKAGNVDDLEDKVMKMTGSGNLREMGKHSLQLISEWNFERIVDSIHLVLKS